MIQIGKIFAGRYRIVKQIGREAWQMFTWPRI